MKKKFLNYSLNLLKKENKYDDGKIAELMYGLEAFYMISTKLIVVIAISIIPHTLYTTQRFWVWIPRK